MRRNLKVLETHEGDFEGSGPYHDVAVRVRNLLQCDYALVATLEADSIRIRAVAGRTDTSGDLAVDLVRKLSDLIPVVVDDSRLIAVPMTRSQRAVGLLIGYSSRPGAFKGDDLGKLVSFSQIAGEILERAATVGSTNRASNEDLLHLSRLITIGELSACFAHEVTNPLMLIRGHLRFIDETLSSDHPLRTNFDVIDRASRRVEEMAKRMLDFSRKRTALLERCDLTELISDALRFMQPYFHGQYIDVDIKLEADLPMIQVDRWHVIQVLVNLLQNAAEAMAQSHRRVLTIGAKTEGSELRLSVADTGGGISPDDLPHIFDPFFTTKGENGTGLGLYISKRVMEDHSGSISVQTGPRGTTFVISLPL